MDENKEILASEAEEKETENFDTDTTDSSQTDAAQNDESFETAFSEELEEMEQDTEDLAAQTNGAVKTKKFIQLPVIISAAILIVVALTFLVFKCFFDTGIKGVWTIDKTSTSDEAATEKEDETLKSYYSFEDNNVLNVYTGTMRYSGTYDITEDKENGTRSVTMNIPQILQTTMQFKVEGNVFTGRKITFTATYTDPTTMKSTTQDTVFVNTKLVLPKLETYKDFKADDKITGKWTFSENGNKMVYEFKADGTVTVNQVDTIFVEGVYTYTKDKITIKYFAGEESTMDFTYAINGNKMTINNYLTFTKDTGSTTDEA